jgi:hypothetical protein
LFFFSHVFLASKNLFYYFLAARVGRKRGKMNLEKTINKNMFDMSSSIRDKNPLETTDLTKNEQQDTSSTPLSSILSNPKQKLTAQFKRAITMIKQRSEPTHESLSSSSPQLLTSLSLTEKPNYSLDQTLLTSLIEEPIHDDLIPSTDISSLKSQSFIHVKPSIQHSTSIKDTDSSTSTIINLDPITRINHQNQSLSTYLINSSLQQIQPSVVQITNQQTLTPQISSSSATLSPTPSSSTTSGELTILVTNL